MSPLRNPIARLKMLKSSLPSASVMSVSPAWVEWDNVSDGVRVVKVEAETHEPLGQQLLADPLSALLDAGVLQQLDGAERLHRIGALPQQVQRDRNRHSQRSEQEERGEQSQASHRRSGLSGAS